jgi:hypothetical protein
MRLWTAVAASLLLACGGDSSDGQDAVYASLAVQILDSFDQESALVATFVDDVDTSGTPEEAAAFAAARAATAWSPEGCAVATPDPNIGARVTFAFAGCAGPFALTGVSGSVSVEYGRGSDGNLSIGVVGIGDVRIGEWTRSMPLRIDGSYVQSGAQRHLTVQASGPAAKTAGVTFDGGGHYETGWDEGAACRSLDGAWDSTGMAFHATSAATGLVRCAGGCPQAGASLVFEDAPPGTRQVTLTFDGGPNASWVANDGETGTIALPCGT